MTRLGQQDVVWFENTGGDVASLFSSVPRRIVSVTVSASSVMYVRVASTLTWLPRDDASVPVSV